jgi:hypothetical protein
MKENRSYNVNGTTNNQKKIQQEVAVTISNKYRQPTIKKEKTATDWSLPY